MSDSQSLPETAAFESVSSNLIQSSRFEALPGAEVDGRFRLIKQIGEGGMGVVYRATQLNINRDVVIKLLKPHLCSNEEQVQRFKREASLASRLAHPNCVTIHDFGFYQNTPYIVMEHLEGEPLIDLMNREHRLDLNTIVGILTQICDALESAQALKVVHRDLKPENIFILREPQGSATLKVLDFGIAKLAHTHPEASEAQLTRGDMIFGTPHYMAPEQIRGRPIDHRTDLYALTVLFYELISGHLPYDADNASDHVSILTQHLRDPVPTLIAEEVMRSVRPMIDQVNALVTRGMAKHIEDRLENAGELRNMLQSLLDMSLLDINAQEMTQAQEMTLPTQEHHSSKHVHAHTFSTPKLGDGATLEVADLLPTLAGEPGFSEPSLTVNTFTSPSTPPQSSHHFDKLTPLIQSTPNRAFKGPPLSGDPISGSPQLTHDISKREHAHSTSPRRAPGHYKETEERGGLSRIAGFVIKLTLLGLLIASALTYSRSPLALKHWSPEWSARLPASAREALNQFKESAHPLYQWIDERLDEATLDSPNPLNPVMIEEPAPHSPEPKPTGALGGTREETLDKISPRDAPTEKQPPTPLNAIE